jgi:glutamate-5-semialdehyde dehydrogenase
MACRAKEASIVLANAGTEQKNEALDIAADLLLKNLDSLIEENKKDLEFGKKEGLSEAQIDRLKLDVTRIESMASDLRSVVQLADPVGRIETGWKRPNGLSVRKVRVPLGVVGIVYENRPNVTSDAWGLCIKSGNSVVLRGSSSAINSNSFIAKLLRDSLERAGLPKDAAVLLTDATHEGVKEMLSLRNIIDCVIPRGGPGLIKAVIEHAKVPVIIDGDGNCHLYIDESADLEMARVIATNAKIQRPGVCNAIETLLVHKNIAKDLLLSLESDFKNVEIRGDEKVLQILPRANPATENDWATEFLALTLAVKIVENIDEAIDHVRKYTSGHSEAIVTNSVENAQKWVQKVDAAAVLVNCSTRFVDGAQLGLGAEIGISTQKLHARGPMGLEALTTLKFVIEGNGQIRT